MPKALSPVCTEAVIVPELVIPPEKVLTSLTAIPKALVPVQNDDTSAEGVDHRRRQGRNR